jgi:hypothetical protein
LDRLGQFDLATRMNSPIMVEKSGFENLVPPQEDISSIMLGSSCGSFEEGHCLIGVAWRRKYCINVWTYHKLYTVSHRQVLRNPEHRHSMVMR